MPKGADVRLTPVSEQLRDRAEIIMRLYEIKDEKDFYTNAFMNMMNMMEKDESIIGVDFCFLVPFILIHENFSFVHVSSHIDISYFNDEIVRHLLKKYFSFMNSINFKHLIEYIIPYTTMVTVNKNGSNLEYKINVNGIDRSLLNYIENFLQTAVEVLNIGKIRFSNNSIEIITPHQSPVDFTSHNHHLVRVDSSVIGKRNQIIAKFNLKNDNKIDKLINDWSLYQVLVIYETLFKNNLLIYDIIYRLNDIYTLFLELRRTGHIIFPKIKGLKSVNYRLIDRDLIQRNLDIFSILITPTLKFSKINNQELIITGLDNIDQSFHDLVKYILNDNNAEIEKDSGGYFRVRLSERIFS
ncbi:hypothetical protein V6M85_05945 [Sulfolobus tengchongensis]|uniref:Uncharacterized protein n=1 Tax=Sulfolobus tengchongensis TaxID=207809 RepID=A0AAX4L428_9CREN